MMKNKKGFTLMELLIVIALISILAAALVVGLNPAKHFRQARHSARWGHMNAISTAVYSYAIEHGGNFPLDCIGEEGEPVTIEVDDYTNPGDGTWCWERVVPGYLRVPPKPPLDGEKYRIEFVGDKEGIKITSSADEASNIVFIQ